MDSDLDLGDFRPLDDTCTLCWQYGERSRVWHSVVRGSRGSSSPAGASCIAARKVSAARCASAMSISSRGMRAFASRW